MRIKANAKPAARALAKGQLWNTGHAYIQIVELGKRLVTYRMLDYFGQPGVKAQMSGVATMWGYLKVRKARLVKPGAAN